MRYIVKIDCEEACLQSAMHDIAEILQSEPVNLGEKIEIPLFDDNGDDFTMASFIIQKDATDA